MRRYRALAIAGPFLIAGVARAGAPATQPSASRPVSPFGERYTWLRVEPGVRVLISETPEVKPGRPVELILYALPNGNTIEWTAGKRVQPGDDWHFGIQHVAAQVRRLREVVDDRTFVLAYLEADGRSWPAWKQKHSDYRALLPRVVETLARRIGPGVSLHLTGHSGGGSFVFGYIDAFDRIPSNVERISFLDSNYGYSDALQHSEKLIEWLRRSDKNVLCVICYDDRHITLNGKPVLKTPLGGTWGSTQRMMDRLRRDLELRPVSAEGYERYQALGGRVDILIHPNPENKILHSELVRWNGLIHAATAGGRWENRAGVFNGPIAYEEWIERDER